jgi:hypothetical protein
VAMSFTFWKIINNYEHFVTITYSIDLYKLPDITPMNCSMAAAKCSTLDSVTTYYFGFVTNRKLGNITSGTVGRFHLPSIHIRRVDKNLVECWLSEVEVESLMSVLTKLPDL